jgi:hypothetical protein
VRYGNFHVAASRGRAEVATGYHLTSSRTLSTLQEPILPLPCWVTPLPLTPPLPSSFGSGGASARVRAPHTSPDGARHPLRHRHQLLPTHVLAENDQARRVASHLPRGASPGQASSRCARARMLLRCVSSHPLRCGLGTRRSPRRPPLHVRSACSKRHPASSSRHPASS